MLALAALGALGVIAGQTVLPSEEELRRRAYDHAQHNSDDPALFHYAQLNPAQYRMDGRHNVREPVLGFIHGWAEHDIKAQQLEHQDSVLRMPNSVEPDDVAALRALQW